MNKFTLVVGMAAIFLGLYSLYLRATHNDKFSKLSGLQKRFGTTKGSIIHFVSYCLFPIVFGIGMIYAYVNNISLFY
ncbi:MAG: hypothetical protein WAM73_18475 [Desulfobacterales bacterium]